MSRTDPELKACPHGREARIINIGGLTPFSIYLGPDHFCQRDFGWFATREDTITAWNQRISNTEITPDAVEAVARLFDIYVRRLMSEGLINLERADEDRRLFGACLNDYGQTRRNSSHP